MGQSLDKKNRILDPIFKDIYIVDIEVKGFRNVLWGLITYHKVKSL